MFWEPIMPLSVGGNGSPWRVQFRLTLKAEGCMYRLPPYGSSAFPARWGECIPTQQKERLDDQVLVEIMPTRDHDESPWKGQTHRAIAAYLHGRAQHIEDGERTFTWGGACGISVCVTSRYRHPRIPTGHILVLFQSYADLATFKEWATFSYHDRHVPAKSVESAGFEVSAKRLNLTMAEQKWLGKARRNLLGCSSADCVYV